MLGVAAHPSIDPRRRGRATRCSAHGAASPLNLSAARGRVPIESVERSTGRSPISSSTCRFETRYSYAARVQRGTPRVPRLGGNVPRRDYAARRLPEACQPVTTHDQKPARSPTPTAPPRATGGPRSPSEGCNCPPATVSRRRAPQTGCAVPRAAPRQPANMRESLVCKKHTPPRAPRPSGRRARPGASARSTGAEIPPQGPCRGGPRLRPGNRSPAPRRCAPGPPAREREPLVCRGTTSPTHLPPASPLAPAAWPPPRRPHEPAGRAGRGKRTCAAAAAAGPAGELLGHEGGTALVETAK